MREHPIVAPPCLVDVLDETTARALIDDARAALVALEGELEEARREPDEAERELASAPGVEDAVTALRDQLLRLAEGMRAVTARRNGRARGHPARGPWFPRAAAPGSRRGGEPPGLKFRLGRSSERARQPGACGAIRPEPRHERAPARPGGCYTGAVGRSGGAPPSRTTCS